MKETEYLTFVSRVSLAPTRGSVNISNSSELFDGFFDYDFNRWGTNVTGVDTGEVVVGVFETKKDGTVEQLFGSLGTLSSLCLTQAQIVEFCQSYRHLLSQDNIANLFLFAAEGKLFLALVYVNNGKLENGIHEYSSNDVWKAGQHRLVVSAGGVS